MNYPGDNEDKFARAGAAGGEDDFPDEAAEARGRQELEALLLGAAPPRNPETGKVVKGTIIQIGEDDVFLDIGAKSEGVIARAELVSKEGNLEFAVGDVIEASVVSVGDVIRLSRGTLRGAKDREALGLAYASRVAVEGRVEAVKKGGFEVALAGGVRAFCPLSQIDDRRVEDPGLWVGRALEFLIVEMDDRARNVVVSRRKVLDVQTAKAREEAKSRIVEGAIVSGRVSSLQGYGAFVDLGGVQGLLHVSEMSHSRPGHPSELLRVGDEVRVQVLRVEGDSGKISLGMKQLAEDPWTSVAESVRPGDVFEARVKRVAEFGAFVELKPGIEGLVHVSELAPGKRGADARKLVEIGADLRVKVIEIDGARRRISLARLEEGESGQESPLEPGQLVRGKVERVEPFGVFLRVGPGQVGLIPNEEMATPRGTDHRKDFGPGTEIDVEVVAVEENGRKIRLSRTLAQGRADRESLLTYNARAAVDAPAGKFSTLGDAFKKRTE